MQRLGIVINVELYSYTEVFQAGCDEVGWWWHETRCAGEDLWASVIEMEDLHM